MAVLSLSEILKNDIIENLEGSDSVLIKTITDLSAKVKAGSDRVQIPKVSGLALASVVGGARATAGGMTSTSDVLIMDQVKQVPEYIDYDDGLNSALDLKNAFLDASPAIFAQGIEAAIASAMSTGAGTTVDSAGTPGAGEFVIGDIAAAKTKLDEDKVPYSDRWLAVNASAMEVLSSFAEFQDGQKSLSDEALKLGVVSQVKGFKVVQSEDVGSATPASNFLLAYHRSACAFALHDGVRFIEQMQEDYGQEFIALRGKYGVKVIDSGNRIYKLTTVS